MPLRVPLAEPEHAEAERDRGDAEQRQRPQLAAELPEAGAVEDRGEMPSSAYVAGESAASDSIQPGITSTG